MIKLKNAILSFYRSVTGSIAFYPSIISLAMSILAVLVLVAEKHGITEWVKGHFDILITYSVDTARAILTVLIGGIFSLMVFSFSMVMILLNQASSYFSPRILPGLISSKSHQYVLGGYLGTLLYCLLVLINIYKPNDDIKLPGFAILLAVVFGISCLWLFVYFIHNISTSIQASNVLFKVFDDTRFDLQKLVEADSRLLSKDKTNKAHETDFELYAVDTGYLQDISENSLLDIAKAGGMTIKMEAYKGMFILKNSVIASTSKKLDKAAMGEVLSCFQFATTERVRDNYVLGIKQITEVAVKAMSPGINDPGTALTAIDYLTELLALRMTISDHEFLEDEDGERRVFFKPIQFKDLIFNVFASLRQYTKHDVVLVQKLLMMLGHLHRQKDVPKKYTNLVATEIKALLMDAAANIQNERDREVVREMGGNLNS